MNLSVEEIRKYHEAGELEKVVERLGFNLEDVITILLIEEESLGYDIVDLKTENFVLRQDLGLRQKYDV